MRLVQLSRHSIAFPSRKAPCEPNGLLALGGDLRPRLLMAYQRGIFLVFPGDRSSGGRPTRRYFGQSNSISAAA